ncbi:MAG: hypothetical protein ACI4GY_10635 [Acutalibacteraceae bacterium]
MNKLKSIWPIKVILSFISSLALIIIALLEWTIFFDGNYVEFEEETLTYREIFDDLSDMGILGYVLYDFNDKRIDLVNEPENNIFKSTSYVPLSKIKGKLLTLFINKHTSVSCVKIDTIDLDADYDEQNKAAEQYFNCESKKINIAYVFKAFGNYYIMVEPRIKSDNGSFVSNSMYACRVADGKQFSEFDHMVSKEKTNYFFLLHILKLK